MVRRRLSPGKVSGCSRTGGLLRFLSWGCVRGQRQTPRLSDQMWDGGNRAGAPWHPNWVLEQTPSWWLSLRILCSSSPAAPKDTPCVRVGPPCPRPVPTVAVLMPPTRSTRSPPARASAGARLLVTHTHKPQPPSSMHIPGDPVHHVHTHEHTHAELPPKPPLHTRTIPTHRYQHSWSVFPKTRCILGLPPGSGTILCRCLLSQLLLDHPPNPHPAQFINPLHTHT